MEFVPIGCLACYGIIDQFLAYHVYVVLQPLVWIHPAVFLDHLGRIGQTYGYFLLGIHRNGLGGSRIRVFFHGRTIAYQSETGNQYPY